MRKIKILYEGLSNNIGGIETYIYNLYNNMDKDKFEISFLIEKGLKIAFYETYKKDNIKFLEVEDRKKNYLKYLKDLKNIYQNNNFDYIHINIMSYSLFERITYACKFSNAKVIVHCHNGGFSKDCQYKRTMFLDKIGRIFVKKYQNNIIKISCGEKAGTFAFNGQNFMIFNNGVDIEKFKFSENNRKTIREELKIKDSTFAIGLIAMFNNPKNHTFLIDIFYEYLKLNNDAKLVLVGEGSLQGEIINKVKNLKIDDKVLFLGKRTDVYKILSALDSYLMPSLYEGLSISLVEAQVNGLKCYTTDRVDKKSDITGNVEFLSLEKSPQEWARNIFNNNDRDTSVVDKIPDEFNAGKSYKKVYKFYEENLK